MNDIRLCYFRFKIPVRALSFFRYRVKNFNPYTDTVKLLASVRYGIISNFKNYSDYKKMFAYADKNENYIYTYEKIKSMPDLSKENAEIELVDRIEMPVSENTDLYSAWTEYYVYYNIFRLNKYDCHEEHNFYLDMPTPKNNLNITLRRKFAVRAKVMPGGTSYIGVDVSTEYYTKSTVYDYMCQGRRVTGMEVKCIWQGYNNSGEITEVFSRNINQTSEKNFNLYDYWNKQAPYRLRGIDPDNTKVVKCYFPRAKHPRGEFIPQSLVPVFRRETVAAYDGKFSRASDKLMKLPMCARLDIMREFINDINSMTRGIVFPEPATAGELGYSVYNAAYNAPALLINNNRKITFREKNKTFSEGFFRLPNNEIIIGFMYFDKRANECRKAINVIIDYLVKGMVNGRGEPTLRKPLLPVRYSMHHYVYSTGYDELSLKMRAKEISRSKVVNFVVCLVPMESDDGAFYEIFKKVFADINMPSQMVSADFLNKLKTGDNKSIESSLKNIALGILSKAGGIPWAFEKPFGDVDCFVGIDVAMQSKGIHYPACSVCLDGSGNLLAYYKTEKAQSGEKIDNKILTEIFDKILIAYNEKNGRYPEHIVIHRDGFSNESDEWYENYFSGKSIVYDIVEVKKNISGRLLDMKNSNGMNPDSATCVIKENEAIIVTTQRYAKYGGAPQPLEIVHKCGSLSMREIATQVYALSEFHVGSVQSTRLPVTTYYADRICKAGEYIPKGEVYNKLYFL